MDLFSIKIEPEDDNQNFIEHEKQDIVNTNPDDISLRIKIEEEDESFTSDEEFSHTKPDSSFDVKIEFDEIIKPNYSFAEATSFNSKEKI